MLLKAAIHMSHSSSVREAVDMQSEAQQDPEADKTV